MMLRKFFADKHGRIAIMQKPNLSLIVWAGAAAASRILPSGDLADGFSVASRTALFIWALMELGWGASYFRRLLGLVVLVWSAGSLFW